MAGVVGVVLAGGRSTRFGSEKAVAKVGKAPMIAYVRSVLAQGCEAVAVNAPEDSGAAKWAKAQGADLLPDAPGSPDGPLAGVLAGLAWAETRGADWLAVAPCDTPWLPGDLVARLRAGAGEAPAAVAVTESGGHPLCMLLRTTLRTELEATLAAGHPSVRQWLDAAGAVGVRFDDEGAFQNLNERPRGRGAMLFDATIMFLAGAILGLFAGGLLTTLLGSGSGGGPPAPGAGPSPTLLVLPILALSFGGIGAAWGWLGRPPWSRT